MVNNCNVTRLIFLQKLSNMKFRRHWFSCFYLLISLFNIDNTITSIIHQYCGTMDSIILVGANFRRSFVHLWIFNFMVFPSENAYTFLDNCSLIEY